MQENKLTFMVSTLLQKSQLLWAAFIVSFSALVLGSLWVIIVIFDIYAGRPTSAFMPMITVGIGICGIAVSFVLLYVKKQNGIDIDTISKIRGEKIMASDGIRQIVVRQISGEQGTPQNKIAQNEIDELRKDLELPNKFAELYDSPEPKLKRKYTKRKATKKTTKREVKRVKATKKIKKPSKKIIKKAVKTRQVKKKKPV